MILDLRVSRLVQIIHTIQTVRMAEINLRRAEITWQTQAICAFLANTVEDQKSRETMVAHAGRLTLLDDDFSDDRPVDTTSSGERTIEDVIENGSIQEAMSANDRKGLNSSMLGKLGA